MNNHKHVPLPAATRGSLASRNEGAPAAQKGKCQRKPAMASSPRAPLPLQSYRSFRTQGANPISSQPSRRHHPNNTLCCCSFTVMATRCQERGLRPVEREVRAPVRPSVRPSVCREGGPWEAV